MEEEVWIYYDYAQGGMSVSNLCKKYDKELSEILKIVLGEPPVNYNTEMQLVTVDFKGELIQKIIKKIGEDVPIKDAIKLMVLDYLDNIAHMS